MYKVGIVGFGKMGMLHGAILNGTREARLVAICDKSWVMRWGFKRLYPLVKTFDDIDKMLSKMDLDIVVIATPTFNHMESALKCIEKGCHVFIEKPLATTSEQAKRIMNAAKRKGVQVQVGYCNRFCPSISRGKEMIKNGIIGKVTDANAYMYIADVFEAHTGWRYSKKTSGGGVLMDFGIHMLDQICWYFGEVDYVKATSKRIYSKEVEDELKADIHYKNGITVQLDTSWSKEDYRKSYSKLEINGENGRLVVTDQTLTHYDIDGNVIEDYSYPQLYSGAFMDIGGLNYSYQMEKLLNIVKEKDNETNICEAVYDQLMVEKLYESADEKRIVKC